MGSMPTKSECRKDNQISSTGNSRTSSTNSDKSAYSDGQESDLELDTNMLDTMIEHPQPKLGPISETIKQEQSPGLPRQRVMPFLRTTIEKSPVSTKSKLRFYIYRDLYVTKDEFLKDSDRYNKIFKELQTQEMNYLTLLGAIGNMQFCRTALTSNAVILQADSRALSLNCMVQHNDIPEGVGTAIGRYLSQINRRANDHSSKTEQLVSGKFRLSDDLLYCVRYKFVVSMELLSESSALSDYIKPLFDEEIFQQLTYLKEKFVKPAERVVVHAAFRPENILFKPEVGFGKLIAYGAEQSHYGQPAYDIGVIVGNLILHYHIQKLRSPPEINQPDHTILCENLLITVQETLDSFMDGVDVDVPMKLIAGYAAAEMLNRVSPITCSEELPLYRSHMIDDITESGLRLLRSSPNIQTAQQVINISTLTLIKGH